jgi:hypothetical protein
MKRASYREAVAWIALNDESGSDDGPEQIIGYASTVMIADLFDVESAKVAQDIHRKREQYRKEGWPT